MNTDITFSFEVLSSLKTAEARLVYLLLTQDLVKYAYLPAVASILNLSEKQVENAMTEINAVLGDAE